MSGVALASFTAVRPDIVLSLTRKALGRSVSAVADSAGYEPPLHHMMCIAAVKEPDLKKSAASVKPYLNLFHAGFLIAADERDFAEILEIAGLPCVLVDTQARDIKLAFITGSVSQWKDALLRGCITTVGSEPRRVYNLIYKEFGKLGLGPAMELFASQERPDKTFLLECKKP
jgi:hypothetical protein